MSEAASNLTVYSDRNDSAIEGFLLKKSSRLGIIHGGWNTRYFRLSNSNTLEYFRKENDARPRASFTLNPSCSVSDLFVEKIHHRNEVYCIRIELCAITESDKTIFSEDSSQSKASLDLDEPFIEEEPALLPRNSSPLRSMFRRQKSEGAVHAEQQPSPGNNRFRHSHNERLRHRRVNTEVPQTIHMPPSPLTIGKNQGGSNDENDELDYLRSEYKISQQKNKRKSKEKLVQTTQLVAAAGATVGVAVVTAGIGLVAGAIALGVAAGAGGGAVATTTFRKTKSVVIASADFETAKRWHSVLAAAVESENLQRTSTWGRQWFGSDDRKARATLLPSNGDDSNRSAPATVGDTSKWEVLGGGLLSVVVGYQGLRVFREEEMGNAFIRQSIVSSKAFKSTALKAQIVLETTPLDAFLCFMTHFEEVIETFDMHTDVIHLTTKPLFLFPSWTSPRDFCLYRYWRLEQDGSYVICFESIEHERCPPTPGFVRGEMHAVYSIQPPARRRRRPKQAPSQCMMTATVQLDPKGWVPTYPFCNKQSYSDAFSLDALLRLLDVRDTIDRDRFVAVARQSLPREQMQLYTHADDSPAPPAISRSISVETSDDTCHEDVENYDFNFCRNETSHNDDANGRSQSKFASCPTPLTRQYWAEPDSNSFRVRGANYKVDRLKQNAGQSIGRLVAVDVITVDEPLYSGISLHPSERIQQGLRREKSSQKSNGVGEDLPPFVFVVNIVLPGPPWYHMVYYFAVDDRKTIDGSDNTPSSKLCQKFFFGESDEFRDATFKLIPQIVQGNFIVRKAVGSTPAIMGKKLRQLYVRNERFMEVILDCGSSPVATGVIRLSLGYAKTLVVDMGFLLEGDEPELLPERVFGCVRKKNIEMHGPHIRHVNPPPS